jgi:hypothetical protein
MDGRGDSAYQKVLATGSQLSDLAHLNTNHGVYGESFVKFLHDQSTRQREEDADPFLIQQKRRETATARISNGSRLTAGIFVCAKGHHLNGGALDIIKRSKEKKEQERLAKDNKNLKERQELKRRIAIVLTKGNYPMRWNVADLKTMVQWFKLSANPAMPARKEELIERYKQKKLRKVHDGSYLEDARDDRHGNDDFIVAVLKKDDNDEVLRDDELLRDDEADVTLPVIMPEALMADDSEDAQYDEEFELMDWGAWIN